MERIYNTFLFDKININNSKLFYNRKKILELKEKIEIVYKVKKYEEGRLDNIIYKIYNYYDNNYKYIIKIINNITNEFTQVKENKILYFPSKETIENVLHNIII